MDYDKGNEWDEVDNVTREESDYVMMCCKLISEQFLSSGYKNIFISLFLPFCWVTKDIALSNWITNNKKAIPSSHAIPLTISYRQSLFLRARSIVVSNLRSVC